MLTKRLKAWFSMVLIIALVVCSIPPITVNAYDWSVNEKDIVIVLDGSKTSETLKNMLSKIIIKGKGTYTINGDLIGSHILIDEEANVIVNGEFWGNEVEITKNASLTVNYHPQEQIPNHFAMNLFEFTLYGKLNVDTSFLGIAVYTFFNSYGDVNIKKNNDSGCAILLNSPEAKLNIYDGTFNINSSTSGIFQDKRSTNPTTVYGGNVSITAKSTCMEGYQIDFMGGNVSLDSSDNDPVVISTFSRMNISSCVSFIKPSSSNAVIQKGFTIIESPHSSCSYPDGYTIFDKTTNQYASSVVLKENHSYENIPGTAKQVSCFTDGKNADRKCKNCGKVVTGTVIKAPGSHTIVIDNAVPATKTSTGLTEGSHCSVCHAVIKKQEVIPALGDTKTNESSNQNSSDNSNNIDDKSYYDSEKINTSDLRLRLKVADKKSGGKYKITKIIKRNGKVTGGSVTYMAPYNKNCTKATAGNYVKIAGIRFKITAVNANAFKNCTNLKSFTAGENITNIGNNAFRGCTSLKSFTIRSKKLKSIGSKAFKGTNAKIKFKVPKKQLNNYKKMIKKAGAPKKAKINNKSL